MSVTKVEVTASQNVVFNESRNVSVVYNTIIQVTPLIIATKTAKTL
jgi:hypothetical protein